METAYINGLGSYLPSQVLTNEDLEKTVDTTNEWIVSRTGICQRHVAAREEATSDLATKAAIEALEEANLKPENIELIIVATFTPDLMMPSTATKVQKNIGASNAFAFDVNAACSGFVYGLSIAHKYVISGSVRNALVIGAETMTKYIDWKDRNSCVLFGDGAGAAVVSSQRNNGAKIIGFQMGSNGNAPREWLMLHGSGSANGNVNIAPESMNSIVMNGKEIFKFSVGVMPLMIKDLLDKYGIPLDKADFIVPHQANRRIIEAAAERLNIPVSKFLMNMDKCANTSAASIPLVLTDARRNNIFQRGDIVVLAAFGAGFTWGGAVLEF